MTQRITDNYIFSTVANPFPLVMLLNSWILKIMLCSRLMPSFALTTTNTWNAVAAFSEECVAKIFHGILLLYLVVIVLHYRMLYIQLLVAATVRRELEGSADAAINLSLAPDHSLARDLTCARERVWHLELLFLVQMSKIDISNQIRKNAIKLSHDSTSQRRLEVLDLYRFQPVYRQWLA